ncbi:hypothetical protein SIN8267_02447 [Sinobacterium norvegicum]|uniref:DUF3332 domain-containing protein n=1 Tax=Sinobacterium norvegicum TaxID=1641715 RepID=A0ABN8EIN8_9GAMM|nr:DUF3332 family protein [Sinobacterium norvegicum]CAH0992328.1 hypothetical protein SIN8267_02447 [Sinobacterium norvegicum]
MKMNKVAQALILATAIGGVTTTMTGCMGQMGLSQQAIGVNLKLIDNRWGRAGFYLLLSPVYGVVGAIDLLIINSIEFWTGTNPITKKSPAVVDTPVEAWMKVDDSLDSSMTDVPLSSATLKGGDNNTMSIDFIDADGNEQTVTGIRVDNRVDFYLDGRLIKSATMDELEARADQLETAGMTTATARG